jgi:hypothetical protein
MNKFLHMLYDITDEATSGDIQKLAEFIDEANISPSAKNSKIPSLEETDKMSSDNFSLNLFVSGVGEIKKFANYSSDLTELNIAMLLKNHKQIPDEICKIAAYNLSRAAKRYDLAFPSELEKHVSDNPPATLLNVSDVNEINYMRKLAKARDAEALSKRTNAFALPGRKRYPLTDESYIKTACVYFEKYQDEFKAIDKLAFCQNTNNAGKKEGVAIEGALAKYANLNTDTFNQNFKFHVKSRQYLLEGKKEAVDIYDELLEKSAELGPGKTLEALEAVDREYKISKYWGSRIEEPLLSVFEPMKKVASIEYDGKTITADSLSSGLRGQQDLAGIIDEYTHTELTAGTKESLDIFESLPMPVKDALAEKIDG